MTELPTACNNLKTTEQQQTKTKTKTKPTTNNNNNNAHFTTQGFMEQYRVVQNKLDTFYKSHFSQVGKYNEFSWRYLQTVIPWEDLVKVVSKLMVK